MIDSRTEQFYATRAEEWASHLPHDISPALDGFLDHLPDGAKILDLGCGDGRDAEHMERRGFTVDATDGVASMVALTSKRISRPARLLQFHELNAEAEYDAIWAHASLHHADASDLPGLLARVHHALKPSGWHFSNYKGGTGGKRDAQDRFYSYIPEADLRAAYARAGSWSKFSLKTDRNGTGFGGERTIWHDVTTRK